MGYSSSYIDYRGGELDAVTKAALRGRSWFQDRFDRGSLSIRFDVDKYPFRDLIFNRLNMVFGTPLAAPVAQLHEYFSDDQRRIDGSGQNVVASALYEEDLALRDLYERFIREVIVGQVLQCDVYYQATPTWRVSFAQTLGYSWKPNYHTDIMLGHPPQEINIWLPLGTVFGSNSLVYAELDDSLGLYEEYGFDLGAYAKDIETNEGLQRRCEKITKSFDAEYGQCLVFDSRCLHVSAKNDTEVSRVSVDFRVIPRTTLDALAVTYVGTGRRRSRFEPGGYYASRPCSAERSYSEKLA